MLSGELAQASGQQSLEGEALSGRFAEAAAAVGELERAYRIGGQDVRLRCAGRALLDRLAPSIEHLRVDGEGGREGHVIELWDGCSTDTAPPPVPPGSELLPPAGIATSVRDHRRAIYQVGVRALSVVDTDLDRSWYWVADAARLPEWECSTPLRHVFNLWLGEQGVQFVHAGAVGRPDGGFLVVGKSGSGKSTTTLASLAGGLMYAGDDYVGVSFDSAGAPYVHSLFGCGKLETEHVSRFPDLRIEARPEQPGRLQARRDKTIFYVRDTYPDQLSTGFRLKGIVVPRVSPADPTALTELPLTLALKALIPSTMFEIHALGQSALTILTRIVREVPAFELRIGTEMNAIPKLLGDALSS
jgi:hypothetical protein